MSVPAPSRENNTASAACITMNSVTPCSRASIRKPAVQAGRHLERHGNARDGRRPPGAAGRRAGPVLPAPRPAPSASTAPGGSAGCAGHPRRRAAHAATARNRRTEPAVPPTPAPSPPAGPHTPPLCRGLSGAVDQPSLAMWCSTSTSTCSPGPVRSSRARSGISADRSNAYAAACGDRSRQLRGGHVGLCHVPRQLIQAEDLLVWLAVGDREDRAQYLVPAR